MLALKGRQNGIRLLLPKNFIAPEIEEKYTRILQQKHSFFMTPIDFINESIQRVELFGIQNATIQQMQTNRGEPIINQKREKQNHLLHTSTEYNYRSEATPLSLIDRTFNIEFRHTVGYLNYFLLFENFWYQYSRDRAYADLPRTFNVDLFDENGAIYCSVEIDDPVINGIDMLSFDNTQVIANASSFKIEFKYSNFDVKFFETDDTLNTDETDTEQNIGSGNIYLDNC